MGKAEFIKKYGDIKVKFTSYYKYTFMFEENLEDGKKLLIEVGGNHDDIYRFDVSASAEEMVRVLDPFAGSIKKDNNVIESFYDY